MTQEHGEDPRAHMGLPLPNGKLAMWLFLVTEIMFFTALIGTYMLIRNGTQPYSWVEPGGQVVTVKSVDDKNDALVVTTSVGDTITVKVDKHVKIIGESGKGLKDDRLAPGSEITLYLDNNDKLKKIGFGSNTKQLARWPTPHEVHLVEAIGAGNTFVLIVSSLTIVLAHYYLAQKNIKRATLCVGITLALGAVFLVVKAYEYTTKFKHDILPGHIGETLPGMDLQQERKYHGSSLLYASRILKQLDHIIEEIGGDYADKRKELEDAQKNEMEPITKDIAAKVKGAEERQATLQKKHAAALKDLLGDQKGKVRDVIQLREDMREKVEVGNYRRPLSPPEVGHRVNKLLEDYPDLHLTPTIPHANMWSSCYFAMTGFHALHVFGGLVVLLIILMMGVRGKLGPQHESMLELTGLYWHFVDIVWIFLFPLLYLV